MWRTRKEYGEERSGTYQDRVRTNKQKTLDLEVSHGVEVNECFPASYVSMCGQDSEPDPNLLEKTTSIARVFPPQAENVDCKEKHFSRAILSIQLVPRSPLSRPIYSFTTPTLP